MVLDSWESLGLQGDPTSPFWRRSALGFLRKEWYERWNSSTLATSCEELTHWKRLWCWEGLGARAEGDDPGWDGWTASLTRWMWVWVNSGRWWWTGRPGVLRFMGSQRVGHDWATELNWTEPALGKPSFLDNLTAYNKGFSIKIYQSAQGSERNPSFWSTTLSFSLFLACHKHLNAFAPFFDDANWFVQASGLKLMKEKHRGMKRCWREGMGPNCVESWPEGSRRISWVCLKSMHS